MEGKEAFGSEKEPEGETRAGEVFTYQGYEVTVVERDENDNTPAWNDIDARSGKRILRVLEGIPRRFLTPLLEHEIYEIEHNFDHKEAGAFGRKKAEELGVADEFTKFEQDWDRIKESVESKKENGT